MNLKEYLIEKYGYNEELAERIVKSSRMSNAELVDKKLKEIFSCLDASLDEQRKMIAKWPHILNISPENVNSKAEFYKKEYGLSSADFRKMAKRNLAVINATNDKVLRLEQYYADKWGLTRDQFRAKMIRLPGIIGLSSDTVDAKAKQLLLEFGVTSEDFSKMLCSAMNFPLIEIDEISRKEQFFRENFGVQKADFVKMLASVKPISYSDDKIMNSYNLLNAKFGITPQQFGIMAVKSPTILGFNDETLEKRVAKMRELGFDNNTIVEHARVLNLNENQLKIRYIFSKVAGFSDSDFLGRGFMYNEDNVYARSRFVQENNLPHGYIYYTEPKFQKKAGLSTSDLLDTYTFDKQQRMSVLEEYNRLFNDNISFTSEEL